MPNSTDNSLNLEQLRLDTPGCSEVTHFNNAGASLMPRPVVDTTIQYLREESLYGGYEMAKRRNDDLEAAYATIAQLINAKDDEIAILENATAAWNMAFYAIPFSPGDRILTSVSEYASNYLNYLNLQQKQEIQLEVIPNDEYGQTSVKALEAMMDEKVKLISITHIPTNNGLVNPAEEIGEVARAYDCLYLLDACQSAGQYPLDVDQIGCDMLSATGRKYLRGPRGTGFLYVRKQVLDQLRPPFLDLHSATWTGPQSYKLRDDARRFENWESNFAAILGLKEAVSYALGLGMNAIWDRIQKLGRRLRTDLGEIESLSLHDMGRTRGGIVTFSVEGVPAKTIKTYLSGQNVNVSISGKSSTLIDMEQRNLEEVIRASLHYYNTEEEIARFAELVEQEFANGQGN